MTIGGIKHAQRSEQQLPVLELFARLAWIDGSPLLSHIEPYRRRLFVQFFDARDGDGRPRFNLGLFGRAKKNWKSADLALGALYAMLTDSPAVGHDSDCYILANDADQASDDLTLVKKLVKANGVLQEWLTVKRDVIERKDSRGFLQILPAGDVVGQHGKSYRFVGYDEIHGYRTWDTFESTQPDPHRVDAQQWVTSYASLFHTLNVTLSATTEFDARQRSAR
jgi:phage terminase large subunit-like protein